MLLDEITRKALALPPSERRQLIGILLESGIEEESRRKSAAELKSILAGLRSLPGEPMSDSKIQSEIHLARAKIQRGKN
jgi:hypothetical protein